MMDELSDWFSEDTATFGDRLAAAREAAGLTPRTLAAKLGVKTAVISSWENDLKEPRANRLQMMSGILGVSMTWLLTGAGDGPTHPEEAGAIDTDQQDILAELRRLRSQLLETSEQLGRLEKRLRTSLKGDA